MTELNRVFDGSPGFRPSGTRRWRRIGAIPRAAERRSQLPCFALNRRDSERV